MKYLYNTVHNDHYKNQQIECDVIYHLQIISRILMHGGNETWVNIPRRTLEISKCVWYNHIGMKFSLKWHFQSYTLQCKKAGLSCKWYWLLDTRLFLQLANAKPIMHCKPIPCNENRVFPVKFSHREIPVMKTGVPAMGTGVPCNENRFFPVWKTSQGKPCSGPVRDCSYQIISIIWIFLYARA